MHIDERWNMRAAARADLAHMAGYRIGRVQAAPAEELSAPGDVGILAIGKEGGVEELGVDGDIVDHFAAEERGRAGTAEDILEFAEAPIVRLAPAAIEM